MARRLKSLVEIAALPTRRHWIWIVLEKYTRVVQDTRPTEQQRLVAKIVTHAFSVECFVSGIPDSKPHENTCTSNHKYGDQY